MSEATTLVFGIGLIVSMLVLLFLLAWAADDLATAATVLGLTLALMAMVAVLFVLWAWIASAVTGQPFMFPS